MRLSTTAAASRLVAIAMATSLLAAAVVLRRTVLLSRFPLRHDLRQTDILPEGKHGLAQDHVGISGTTGDLGTALAWLRPEALLQSSPPFGD